MKRILAVGGITAVLFLLLGTTASVYGQEDQGKGQHKQQATPAQQQQQRAQQQQQARPAQQQQRAQQQQQQASPMQQQQRAQQQARPVQQQEQRRGGYPVQQRTQEQARGWQQQRGWLQQGGWQGHSSWQQDRAQNWQVDHRNWSQRGGYGGYFIPQDRFALYFGPRHWFRIRSRPIIVDGYPLFQYGGFRFMMVDPWPESWAEGWYESDDVYVDYNDGYYLYNRRDPGVAIAISVVL